MNFHMLGTLHIAIFYLITCMSGVGVGAKTLSTVVLLDYTKASGKDWNAQINFLMELLSNLKSDKVALVSIACPSAVVVGLTAFDANDFRQKITAVGASKSKGTADAFNTAATIVDSLPAGEGKMIIMSDGVSERCGTAASSADEFTVAGRWLTAQRGIFYITTGVPTAGGRQNAEKIAGIKENVIEVTDFAEACKYFAEELAIRIRNSATVSFVNVPAPAPVAPAPVAPAPPAVVPTAAPPSTPGCIQKAFASMAEDKTVLFVFDSSEDVGRKVFDQMKGIVADVADTLQGARIGLISISCPPKMSVPILRYTRSQFRSSMNDVKYLNGSADLYASLDLARDYIYAEPTKWKIVIIVMGTKATRLKKCVATKNKGIKTTKREKEIDVAEELRELGVHLMFLQFEPRRNPIEDDYFADSLTGHNKMVFQMTLPSQNNRRSIQSVNDVTQSLSSVCFPPKADYNNLPTFNCKRGTVFTPAPSKSVAFILDNTGMVDAKLEWSHMANFVSQLAQEMGITNLAAVSLACPAQILINMDSYNRKLFERQLLLKRRAPDNTDLNGAFGIVKKMIDAEKTVEKYVIVISIGNVHNKGCNDPTARDDAYVIADNMRKAKVEFTYVTVKPYTSLTKLQQEVVLKIAGDQRNIIEVDTEFKLSAKLQKAVMQKTFCI